MNQQFLQKIKNPFLQAFLVLVLFCLSYLVSRGFEAEQRIAWTLAIAFLLLYILYNVMIGLAIDQGPYYWIYSLAGFAGLIFAFILLAQRFSGLRMDEAGSYRWLFFIFCPIYLLFIAMITIIKKIVQMAEKEDQRFDNQN